MTMMDELICRAYHGRVTEAEEKRLLVWRRGSRENDMYYHDLLLLLREASSAQAKTEMPAAPPVELLAPKSVRRVRATTSAWSSRVRSIAVGSAAAAALATLLLLPRFPGSSAVDPFSFGTGEIVTGSSESTTVTLGDGTVVRLGPASRLRVVGSPGTREVWMQGRAYFAVAKHDGKPFRVRTHAGDAVVLGTRFDLQATKDEMQLLVIDGAVELGAGGKELDLKASQLGKISRSLPPVRVEVDDSYIERELSWVGNFIAFEATPLSRATRELSAHYDVPIEVLDGTLARETVRGVFHDQDLEEVIRVLCRATAAHCTMGPTGVTIGR